MVFLRRSVLIVLALGAASGCGARTGSLTAQASRQRSGTGAPTVSSNILRQDYAGSASCQGCHGEVVSAWRRSPMHRMTRLPDQTEVRAPFDGRTFHFKGDVARLEQANGARFMRLTTRERGHQLFRVTKVIGGRYREDFAGVEVIPSAPGGESSSKPLTSDSSGKPLTSDSSGKPLTSDSSGKPLLELILPVSYVFENSSLRLKGYSVMVGERPGLRAGGVWNQTCIFCHNTVPYFDDLWGALHGPGAPGYQGQVVDRALPTGRSMRYVVTDPGALVRAVEDEVAVLQSRQPAAPLAGDLRAVLRQAMLESRERFTPSHFIEVGIGCEACHGGAREHVEDPRLHPTFEPRASFLTVSAPAGVDAPISGAEWQNRACARCHQVLFSRYPRTWEGGTRRAQTEAGGSHINSGEARDFLLGGCARAMACSTCHDPHGEDRPETLARLATPAGNGVCTGCHQTLATGAALKRHARHEPTGAGGACVACHMPRKNMGLNYGLTRYHRIGSPTDVARVEGDRPLECALCHADKTVGKLLADIGRMWGKRYDAAAVVRLYGSPEANVLVSTIERGHAHEQAAAMGAAGAQRFQPAVRAIARQSQVNSYPLVRYHAVAALAAIAGKPVPSRLGSEEGIPHGGVVAPASDGGSDDD